jgi:fumarate hydratase class I
VQSWKAGDRLLLSARCSPGATPRTSASQDMLADGEELPVSFQGRAIYYVGPVDPVMGEVVGPGRARPPRRGWTSSPT